MRGKERDDQQRSRPRAHSRCQTRSLDPFRVLYPLEKRSSIDCTAMSSASVAVRVCGALILSATYLSSLYWSW